MRFQLQKASAVTDTPAMIHIEPHTDKERETMEQLVTDHPSMVIGYGRHPGSMELMHMQLAVLAKPTEDDDEPITAEWLLDNFASSWSEGGQRVRCGNFVWYINNPFNQPKSIGRLTEINSIYGWKQPRTRGELRTLIELTTPTA